MAVIGNLIFLPRAEGKFCLECCNHYWRLDGAEVIGFPSPLIHRDLNFVKPYCVGFTTVLTFYNTVRLDVP